MLLSQKKIKNSITVELLLCLVGRFLFLFSKQYEKKYFLKIEFEGSHL